MERGNYEFKDKAMDVKTLGGQGTWWNDDSLRLSAVLGKPWRVGRLAVM